MYTLWKIRNTEHWTKRHDGDEAFWEYQIHSGSSAPPFELQAYGGRVVAASEDLDAIVAATRLMKTPVFH